MNKFAVWNIRGCDAPHKQREISKYIRDKEIKVRRYNIISVKDGCFSQWNLIHNTPERGPSRVWVAWDPNVFFVEEITSVSQAITVRISFRYINKTFIFTGVYEGDNKRAPRSTLWRYLEVTASILQNEPWIIRGDLNVVRKGEDRIGGNGIDWEE